MKILLSYTRSTFWIVGIVTILVGLTFVPSFLRHGSARPASIVFLSLLLLVNWAVGATTCLAAWALQKQGRFAKTLVALASIYNLPLFPFGTVAGAVGLWWCCSPKLRRVKALAEGFDYQSKKGDGTQKWIQIAVSVGSVAILLGSLGAASWWGVRHGLPRNAAINGLVLLFLCEWIAAFFHELGHTIAGWMTGMRLATFSVGPFAAQKKAGRWKYRLTLAPLIGQGGGVGSVPLHLGNLRRRMAVEVAAGPVASLVTAAAAMAVLSAMPGSAWVMWWKVPAVVAAMSAGAVAINAMPFRAASGFSDGALLMQLLRGGPFADTNEALKTIGITTVTSVRPQDLDPAVMARGANASVEGPMAGVLRMIEMVCAVDRGDLALARECLESVLRTIPGPDKIDNLGVAAELGFYIAYLDGHAGRAGQWMQDLETVARKKKSPLPDFDYWRAVAAVRLAEGRHDEFEDAWQRAQALAYRFPCVGLYEYEREVLNAVKQGRWLRMPQVTGSLPPAEMTACEGAV